MRNGETVASARRREYGEYANRRVRSTSCAGGRRTMDVAFHALRPTGVIHSALRGAVEMGDRRHCVETVHHGRATRVGRLGMGGGTRVGGPPWRRAALPEAPSGVAVAEAACG